MSRQSGSGFGALRLLPHLEHPLSLYAVGRAWRSITPCRSPNALFLRYPPFSAEIAWYLLDKC